ncbi:hypothetical protein PENFLA_c024G10783 [Penicillium flavigenum]|uniref:BTB domain-containing protein n=1 Tax=Penicillium flavigenum TaxID=254877 RepID=A0A1V6STV0_9EURO|nr:hypothetical protein PENFLA_c024G10783 [Penicillium flavigenum]
MGETAKESAEPFIPGRLPLYQDSVVRIRIKSIGCEYTVSKELLCAQSSVFTAMFEGGFREAQQQTVDLEEMEDVVSKKSHKALFQWLHLGFIGFGIHCDPEERIEAAIELARLADKYEITRIESQTAQYIKETIIANRLPADNQGRVPIDSNTHLLGEEDIISALMLRDGHPVRHVLAAACVRGYLQKEKHDFASTAREYPKFAADLLHEARLALNTLTPLRSSIFKDPIGGKKWYLENL